MAFHVTPAPDADDLCVDACPDCDRRNPTLPGVLLAEGERSVTFGYVCSAGHEWTCSWADPQRAAERVSERQGNDQRGGAR